MIPQDSLSEYPTLRDDQRIAARKQARTNLIAKLGGAPQFADYERQQVTKYGPTTNRIATITAALVLLAAFVISAVHIYSTGRGVYLDGAESNQVVALIMGAALVVLAESAILALSVLPEVWNTPPRVTLSLIHI